jgi:DNA-binding response OmpR family regulator
MTIIIAEDDLTSRIILETVLRKQGYSVLSFSDGEEAWQALQKPDTPRLAILDWMMPGLDGPEICRRVKQLPWPDPPYLILLTALGRKADIVSGLTAGADDYLVKPFDREELLARVQVGLRMVALQGRLAQKIRELEDAAGHIRTLQGILPICMYCHKIRNDQESWLRLEHYIEDHSEAQFSHSLCPECLHKHYPEIS